MTEPAEIRLSLADILAELTLGAMAREVEMDEGDEEAEISGRKPLQCPCTSGSSARPTPQP